MASVRIMIYNAGYLTGITGTSPAEYLRKLNRITLPSTVARGALAASFLKELQTLSPDILFMTEIRPDPYCAEIQKHFGYSTIDVKYAPESLLRSVPYFRANSSGVFQMDRHPTTTYYLKHGAKRLVHIVDITDECMVLFVHCALRKETRKAQFAELAHLIRTRSREHVIVGGDFNIFDGPAELEELLSVAHLRIANDLSSFTFPTDKPRQALDLFLVSRDLPVTLVKTLSDYTGSDHVPVVIDVTV
jgi:hypothetical protein